MLTESKKLTVSRLEFPNVGKISQKIKKNKFGALGAGITLKGTRAGVKRVKMT